MKKRKSSANPANGGNKALWDGVAGMSKVVANLRNRNMEQTVIPIESIREKDVDLILLEELSTDNSFCEWFNRGLDLPTLVSVSGAWRSNSTFGLGETDVLFSYNSNDKKAFVLIENILDT